jgi:hypothetical protein
MSTIRNNRSEASDPCHTWAERALLDRLNRLQVVLPALALDVATARREAARLRVENGRLARSLAELEHRHASVAIGHTASADA